MNKKNNICLIDFRLTGHHPFYLANFAHTFQQLDCKVDIFTPDVDSCIDALKLALPELELDNIKFIRTNSSTVNGSRLWGCRVYFNLIRLQREIRHHERIAAYQYGLVFFAYLDDVAHPDFILPYLIKAPFTMNFSGLLMAPREKVLRKLPPLVRHLITTFLEQNSANSSELGLLVEDVKQPVEKKLKKHTIVYPDFCSSTPLDQVSCPINDEVSKRKNGRVTTSLLGSIQPHKSVDLFFDCVRSANPKKHFFVVAGKFRRSAFSDKQWKIIQPIMENPPENLIIFNEWLNSEAVFDSLVQQSDYLFAYYRNFKKSSNVLTKGAFYKKPVIVSEKYLMGERVRKYKLGFSLSEEKTLDMYKNESINRFEFDENLRQIFVDSHSVERLKTIFSRQLQDI